MITKEAVEDWVLAWFEERAPVPGEDKSAKLGVNYFEAGLVDSLGVMELVDELEEKYGILFSEDHFQDRQFAIIGGLVQIVNGLR